MGVSDEKMIKLLGQLVVEYSELMSVLDLLSCELFGIEQEKWQIFNSKISDKLKIECFDEILKLKKPEQHFIKIKSVVGRINTVEQCRNKYLHSAYIQSPDEKTMRLKFSKELNKPSIFEINPEELQKLVDEIIVLRKDVVSLARVN